jgi:hypothetical protein
MKKEKIFEVNGKDISYEDILAKIYQNSEERSHQITKIVTHLRDSIKNAGDAAVMAPWIAEYLATSVKNDDNLIKLAAIISRVMKGKPMKEDANNFGLTPEMLNEIKREIEESQNQPGMSR